MRALALTLLCACGSEVLEFSEPASAAWPQPSLVPPVAGPRLAVTNAGEDTISFVDPVTFAELARVPVGRFPAELEGPHHLAASADGRFLWVGLSNTVPSTSSSSGPHGSHGQGTSDGYLIKIDARTGRQLERTRVARSPGDVRLDPTGRFVWQSHFDLATIAEVLAENGPYEDMDSPVAIVDADSMAKVAEFPVCPAGHGIAFSGDGSRGYIACSWSDEVAVVDVATGEVRRIAVAAETGLPPSPLHQPYALAVSPVDGSVWVPNLGRQPGGAYALRVVDTEAGRAREAVIELRGAPFFGSFTREGDRYYVVTQSPDVLYVIDPAWASIAEELELGPLGCEAAHSVALSPDEERLWIVCEGDRVRTPGSLLFLDRDTLALEGRTELGLYPDDVIWVPAPEAP